MANKKKKRVLSNVNFKSILYYLENKKKIVMQH